jgi:hypothetical protein
MMGHQVTHLDRRGVREAGLDGKLGDVLLHRMVQVDPAKLDLLHDGRGREQLGDRTDHENGFRIYRTMALTVRETEAGCPGRFLSIDQGKAHTGNLQPFHIFLQKRRNLRLQRFVCHGILHPLN